MNALNAPEKIYVLEIIKPGEDSWIPSRVSEDRETAEMFLQHMDGHKWVGRVVEFVRVGGQ